jgi:cytochrome c556
MTSVKLPALLVITALLLAAGGPAVAQHQHDLPSSNATMEHMEHAAGNGDERKLVRFPEEMRQHTLSNMRDHLTAIAEIQEALAQGALDRAAAISEKRLGMTSLAAHNAHQLSEFMPQGMQDIGNAMHRNASRFAVAAQDASATGDIRPALRALAEVTQSCAGCHAAYRVQ